MNSFYGEGEGGGYAQLLLLEKLKILFSNSGAFCGLCLDVYKTQCWESSTRHKIRGTK